MPRLSPQPAGGATCLEDGMRHIYEEDLDDAWAAVEVAWIAFGRAAGDTGFPLSLTFQRPEGGGYLATGGAFEVVGPTPASALLALRAKLRAHAATAS